jgi:hypothetical protein
MFIRILIGPTSGGSVKSDDPICRRISINGGHSVLPSFVGHRQAGAIIEIIQVQPGPPRKPAVWLTQRDMDLAAFAEQRVEARYEPRT